MARGCRSLVIIGLVIILLNIAILPLECLGINSDLVNFVLFYFFEDSCSVDSPCVAHWLLLVDDAHLAHFGFKTVPRLREG